MAARSISDGRLTARYDGEAGIWHAMLRRLGYFAAYDELAAFASVDLRRADAMLDAGVGSGALTLAALSAGAAPRVLDILDPSEKMLGVARENLMRAGVSPTLIEGRIDALAGREERYDVVLCAHVIEHCADPAADMALLRRSIKPGGAALFAISKPHWCTAIVRWKWGSKAYDERDARAMISGAGFAHVDAFRFSAGPPSRTSMAYVARA